MSAAEYLQKRMDERKMRGHPANPDQRGDTPPTPTSSGMPRGHPDSQPSQPRPMQYETEIAALQEKIKKEKARGNPASPDQCGDTPPTPTSAGTPRRPRPAAECSGMPRNAKDFKDTTPMSTELERKLNKLYEEDEGNDEEQAEAYKLIKSGSGRGPRGKGISREALKTTIARLYKPKGWTAPSVSVPYPREMPSKAILAQMAEAVYDARALSPSIDGWEVIKSTPTLKFYRKGPLLIVAIRGTADAQDLKADFNVAFNRVDKSARYQTDLKTIKEMIQENPDMEWYGVGHSLGGAILDALIRAGYLKAGVSFNPAIEKSELQSRKNYRIYMENDPLFNAMGQYAQIGEIYKQSKLHRNDLAAATQSLKAHSVSNFAGGSGSSDTDFNNTMRGLFGLDSTKDYKLKKLRETNLLEPSDFDVTKTYDASKENKQRLRNAARNSAWSRGGAFPVAAVLSNVALPAAKSIVSAIEGDQSLTEEEIENERQRQQYERSKKEGAESRAYREAERNRAGKDILKEDELMQKDFANYQNYERVKAASSAERNPTKQLSLRHQLQLAEKAIEHLSPSEIQNFKNIEAAKKRMDARVWGKS